MSQKRERLLFCFVGPTASGKSTLCKRVVERVKGAELSISTTTRAIREGEKKGRDYFFVTAEEFASRVNSGSFVEYASYNGNFYGTEYRNVDYAAEKGVDLILDIEVQGVVQLKQRYGSKVVVVFVIPPTLVELERRLRGRATESEEVIQSRLKIAQQEIAVLSSEGFSDYILVNDSLEDAAAIAMSIVEAERCRVVRNLELVKSIVVK